MIPVGSPDWMPQARRTGRGRPHDGKDETVGAFLSTRTLDGEHSSRVSRGCFGGIVEIDLVDLSKVSKVVAKDRPA